jgi:hypothetical protein
MSAHIHMLTAALKGQAMGRGQFCLGASQVFCSDCHVI